MNHLKIHQDYIESISEKIKLLEDRQVEIEQELVQLRAKLEEQKDYTPVPPSPEEVKRRLIIPIPKGM